jgi:23S rRNA pseudouridine2457 synthase
LLFNKPYQVLCQFSSEGDKKTLAEFLPGIAKDIYPVGRLDYDSEGLILLTNDKSINELMLDPKKKHERTYWVQVEGDITGEAVKLLERGVQIQIDGKKHITLPAKATKIAEPMPLPDRDPPIRFRQSIPTSWLSLTLTEGKNRQVRRMTAAVGFPTLRLIRCSIGKLSYDRVEVGHYIELSRKEI